MGKVELDIFYTQQIQMLEFIPSNSHSRNLFQALLIK
jgi:hypothetical protein